MKSIHRKTPRGNLNVSQFCFYGWFHNRSFHCATTLDLLPIGKLIFFKSTRHGGITDRHTEITLIQEIIGLAEQKLAYMGDEIAHSPISRYSSPERFKREQAMIFRRKPVVAAHSSELAGVNSFIARDFLGLPLRSTRNEKGKVNAFLNVC